MKIIYSNLALSCKCIFANFKHLFRNQRALDNINVSLIKERKREERERERERERDKKESKREQQRENKRERKIVRKREIEKER